MTQERIVRIEQACQAVLHSDTAKDAFRKTATLFPDAAIFWNEDEDDSKAMLEWNGLLIEFYDVS